MMNTMMTSRNTRTNLKIIRTVMTMMKKITMTTMMKRTMTTEAAAVRGATRKIRTVTAREGSLPEAADVAQAAVLRVAVQAQDPDGATLVDRAVAAHPDVVLLL
jgi:hypothetical protein